MGGGGLSAFAVAERTADAAADAFARAEGPRGGLAACLFAAAHAAPQRTALRDSGDRAGWCGRPPIVWTYAAAAEIVGRLARGIGGWRLPAGSRIGLWFSGGAEAALAHLAVETAGHLPCAMPASWDDEQLAAGIETAGLVGVLTEGRRGERRPAEDLTRAAMRQFNLRYLAAFGPGVPDGVISLDAMALERGVAAPGPSLGLVTFEGGEPDRPVYRTAAALAAAIAAHLDALPLTADERILTLLPAHDLRGLVTGLGAALTVGAGLETVIPFDEAGFRAALLRPVPTRLVAPARIEPALAALPLPWTVRALNVVHRAPSAPAGHPRLRGTAATRLAHSRRGGRDHPPRPARPRRDPGLPGPGPPPPRPSGPRPRRRRKPGLSWSRLRGGTAAPRRRARAGRGHVARDGPPRPPRAGGPR